jgi:hypothetical protein
MVPGPIFLIFLKMGPGTIYLVAPFIWHHLFLFEGEKSEVLIRVAFDSLGQKQHVLKPYNLSLSSMVAAAISQNLYLSNELLRIRRCFLLKF